MDNFKKSKRKNQKKILFTILVGLAVIGILFAFYNADFSSNNNKNTNLSQDISEDYFEDNRQQFILDNCYIELFNGTYFISSDENNFSYFYGNYIIEEYETNYIIKCFYDTHNTTKGIEYFCESGQAFEFVLSSDKKELSAVTDFNNFSFDELIF